jgi:hypothetical protein
VTGLDVGAPPGERGASTMERGLGAPGSQDGRGLPRRRADQEKDPIAFSGTSAEVSVCIGGPDPPLRHRSRRCGPQRRTRSGSPPAEPAIRSAEEDPIRLSATGAGDTVRIGGPDPALRQRSRRCGPQRRTRSGSPPPEPTMRSAEEDPIRLSATGAGDTVRRGGPDPALRHRSRRCGPAIVLPTHSPAYLPLQQFGGDLESRAGRRAGGAEGAPGPAPLQPAACESGPSAMLAEHTQQPETTFFGKLLVFLVL